MFQRAKELFGSKPKQEQKQKANHLYRMRLKALLKTETKKLNPNLIFNEMQYKSQKDDQLVLEKRRLILTKAMGQSIIDVKQLRRLAWNGIETSRHEVWKLLLGYLSPVRASHQQEQLAHLHEYRRLLTVHKVSECPNKRLVEIDIPRTFFEIQIIFSQPRVQQMLSRVLCLWDMTSEGYTQGMGDIAGLLLMILVRYDQDPEVKWLRSLDEGGWQMVEAQLYWLSRTVCTKFFGYYNISKSKDIEKVMETIQGIIQKSDSYLSEHLKNHGVSIFQFAFRWIYVLLSREIPIRLVFRLMDSYFSSSEDFEVLHCFVVSSLLLRFSVRLLKIDNFHVLMRTLQSLPTQDWTKRDIELLVEQAVILMHTYSK